MKKLHVALIVAARVPVEKYGGTERQVVWLARELLRRGHAVTLIASPGPFVPGARMISAGMHREAFDQVPSDVDIVNANDVEAPAGFDKPCLISRHGNRDVPGGGNRNFVSRNHAELTRALRLATANDLQMDIAGGER